MDRLSVTFRKWDVRYLPAGEPIQVDEPIGNFDELEDRLLAEHPRMRRILVQLSPTSSLVCLYLHWGDGTDLGVLDELVAAEYAGEEYFSGAVVGQAGGITCLKCHAILRVVSLEVVVTSLFFERDNLARTRGHAYRRACAVCGERWTASVLEFVDAR
jgi:hypothetical protein